MDNVTHSLAGLLIAEAGVRLRGRATGRTPTGPTPSARFRWTAAVASVVGANLPDADLLYSGLGGDRLRYILHHRGYTHTLVLVLVGAALVWGAALVVWRWRARGDADQPPDAMDARWLLGIVLTSTLGHLALDWTNSYGVHPWWPVDDRWRYGDAVFIVEPWFWVVSVPTLVAASGRRWARVLLTLVLGSGLALAWAVPLVPAAAAALLTAGAFGAAGLAWRQRRPGTRVATALVAWGVVTLAMAAGTRTARAAVLGAVAAATRATDARTRVLDVVVAPVAATPWCASAISLEVAGPTYRVVTARVSALPALVPARRCGPPGGIGSALSAARRASTDAVQWDGEWSAPWATLAALARESCPARAMMRFVRAPIWGVRDDTTAWIGDVRLGGGSGGRANVVVPRHTVACPPAVPPWVPPRADLLRDPPPA